MSPQHISIGWSRLALRTACCWKTNATESTYSKLADERIKKTGEAYQKEGDALLLAHCSVFQFFGEDMAK
jgi:hypothetical protein